MAFSFRGAAISIGKRANAYYSSPFPANHLGIKYHNLGTNGCLSKIQFPRNQTGYMYSIRATNAGGPATVLDTPKEKNEEQSSENWKIKMLYDGDCPLCMREVNMLRERNKRYGTIKFVDISSEEYSPENNQNLDYETVMGRIHAIQSDGTVVTDIEAFRKLYEAVGLGWVYAITKYEPVAAIADAVYGVWAKYRLQITGRPPLEEVLEARRNKRALCNDDKACKT